MTDADYAYAPTGDELRAGRLLAGVTLAVAARAIRLTRLTVMRLERGEGCLPGNRARLIRSLALAGVHFDGPGMVSLGDRRAPTRTVVGKLTGERIRAARFQLKMPAPDLAVRAKVVRSLVNKIEGLADCGVGVSQLHLYQVFNALEAAGYRFGRVPSMDGLRQPAT